MDYSAEQQQQQQQQQQQYHQQYQQQQQHQPYDPSHAQAYDAYYASYYQQQQQQQQYDPSAYQHHQYYPTDYSASASSAAYPTAQPDPAPHDPSQIHAPPQHHAAATGHGYPPPAAAGQEHVAAALSALSQLTEFAGTMSAAERAMAGMPERQWHVDGGHPPPPAHHYPPHPQPHNMMQLDGPSMRPAVGGRSPFRGGGRRGGRRGGGPYVGGRGNFGHHPPRQDGSPSPSPFRGRGRGRMGRGRGVGRQPSQSTPHTQPSHAVPVPVVGSSLASEPSAVKAPMQPRAAFFPVAWCDICRVDCNSLEILEQHKNGKRHKKTVQRLEKMQQQQSFMAEQHATSFGKPEMVPPKVEEHKAASVGEPDKTSLSSESILAELVTAEMGQGPVASESMLTPTLMTEKNMDPETQNQTVEGQSETAKAYLTGEVAAKPPSSDAPEVEVPSIDGKDNSRMGGYGRFDRRRGGKRKMMTFGRGGKRLRYTEPVQVRKPAERIKVREQPRFCTVCNVMCDTLAVFECHLSGKKHITRLKLFQGQGAVYGPIPVYIPPNQPTASQGLEPVCYGFQSHDMTQQEAYGITGLQVKSFGRQQRGQPRRAREADGSASVIQVDKVSEHPKGEVLPANVGEDSVPLDPESLNAVREFEAKESSQEPISLGSEAAMLDESGFTLTEDVLPVPEYGASIGDNVALPGLDIRMEEPSANNEELAS